MGQVYDFLGLTVGIVTSTGAYRYDASHIAKKRTPSATAKARLKCSTTTYVPATKMEAYAADITYITNNELGFDYLRDNTAYDASQIVQRGQYHYAIIDEVDSILIDEARTPLIITGPSGDSQGLYERFARIVRNLNERGARLYR